MAKEDEIIKTEEELKVEKEAKEAAVAEKLAKIEAKVNDSSMLAKILADPDVRQILEAKQKGEKIKVVEDKLERQVVVDDVDYEELSNKELAKQILSDVTTNIDTTLASKLEPLTEAIKNFEGYVGGVEAETVGKQIKKAQEKYDDFNVYVPDMKELNKLNPSLVVEELYLIAKRRKLGPMDKSISSEKPTSSSAKVAARKRAAPLPKGRAGFSQLLNEALDDLELPEIET